MKQAKVILAMVLAVSVVFTTSPVVLAQEIVDYGASVEIMERSETQSPADTASTLEAWNCLDCAVLCELVCLNHMEFCEAGEHSTGFLGLGEPCYTEYYISDAVVRCPVCYKEYYEYYNHWCVEVHATCDKGIYDVCPTDWKEY